MRVTYRIIALVLLMLPPRVFAADLTPAQQAAICRKRASCSVAKLYQAGKSPAGEPLTVVQARFGIADKPQDAPDEGCHNRNGFDGGTEYWLLTGQQPPRLALALCSDGYGSAGVGEDQVEIGTNSLTRTQTGGSAWRFLATTRFSLVPFRATGQSKCLYNDAGPDTGSITQLNFLNLMARSIVKDSSAKWADSDLGCPSWPAGPPASFATPGSKLLPGYNVVFPVLDGALPAPGFALKDCAMKLATDGSAGFVVYGQPAPAADSAEVKLVGVSSSSLLVQIFDPLESTAPAGSWIKLPHIELWTANGMDPGASRPTPGQLSQLGIDLNGRVYKGIGKTPTPPSVEHWRTRDNMGRMVAVLRLTWPDETALAGGIAIVYSQAQSGQQARLVSTTSMIKYRPLFLPPIIGIADLEITPTPACCTVRSGQLSLVEP